MKKTLYFLIFCVLLAPYLSVSAEESDFDPNYIISDEEIQNSGSMNREDIQAFLEDYKSYLVGYRSLDAENANRTASDIIYRAAIKHRINPKYLLVKLQKEQSLITNSPPTQKQLDWATGYGICDDCSMSDPALHKHGNQNFWTLWQKWFDQVYPDGSLIRTSNSPTIYLIQNGVKRPFKNMSALITRFDPKYILNVPEVELKNYELGAEISLPNYSILKNGGNYYLLDYDSLRPFASYEAVRSLGYHPDEIIEANSTDIASFSLGKVITAETTAPLGRVLRVKENNKLYYINDGKYYSITDEKIAKINYPNISVENATAIELANFTPGDPLKLKDGTLFGITGNNKIYVVENGKKRHIASEDVFNGLGYRWENIAWVNEFAGMAHPTGQAIYIEKETTKEILTTLSEETVSSPDAVSETEP